MFRKLISRQILWLLIVLLYGGIVAHKAVQEHDYIYDSKHYETVLNSMDEQSKETYFNQKCNTIDLDSDAPEPVCYSLPTIDSGTMYFDITTPRAEAEKIQKEYNDVAYLFVAIASLKFLTLFILIWLIPSVMLYPFWEWFLSGYIRDSSNESATLSTHTTRDQTVLKVEGLVTKYFKFLDERGPVFNLFLGTAFAILFGIFDIISPPEYSFILIYVIPIALTTWFAGQTAGFFVTVICLLFWSQTSPHFNLQAFAWNIMSTLSIFFLVSVMLTRLRLMWEKDNILSRTDQLTGVMNRRAFDEIVEYEILNLRRQSSPFSLAYIDLDNFKEVNDRFGHKQGDELLKAVTACMVENLRRTDVVARMGGDEFTVFLPATDQNAVKLVMPKLVEELRQLSEKNNWPTTFSIGVITSVDSKCSLEKIITLADRLMYEVKQSGKNDVRYLTAPQET